MTEFVTVVADDMARAWLDTVLAVYTAPERKAFHTVTRVQGVGVDGEPRIHRAASDLLAEFDLQPLDTVANTIFPAAMALRTPDIEALTERYEEIHPQLKRLEPKNRYGTYFHRLVAYPGPNGPVNQLERVITNLTRELSNDSPKRARFETSLEVPADAVEVPASDAEDRRPDADDRIAHTAATPLFTPGRDTRSMGFPCLSFLSFQHDRANLHAVAHYRSQHLMERGLGNYLGIARLMRYLAQQVGLQAGGLTVVAGQACADHLKKVNVAELEGLWAALDASAATSETAGLPAGGT